jgi:hypothetical protein
MSDHFGGTEGKRLLRHAMRDLLPAEILAPRAERTGTPQDYAGDALMRVLASASSEQFQDSALESLGLINIPAFERARMKFLRSGSSNLRLPLLLTLHTELWLHSRGLMDRDAVASVAPETSSLSGAVWASSEPITSDAPEESSPLFILEKFGTLRDLTAGHPVGNAKRPLVNDLATVYGPGDNVGCNIHAQPWSHAGCPSISH